MHKLLVMLFIIKLNSRINVYKLDLRRGFALSNLSICYTWKNIKRPYSNINLRYQLQHEMMNLNYQMSHVLYPIFNTILNIF